MDSSNNTVMLTHRSIRVATASGGGYIRDTEFSCELSAQLILSCVFIWKMAVAGGGTGSSHVCGHPI